MHFLNRDRGSCQYHGEYLQLSIRGKLVLLHHLESQSDLSTPAYQFSRERLGSLDCGVVRPVDQGRKIRSLAVFCHGFGAGGDDLVGLAGELLQLANLEEATMLLFPAAPLSLEAEGIPGGRAWWNLSVQRLLNAMEAGHFEAIREEIPAGIDSAREMLVEAIQHGLEKAGLDEQRLLLGGFSQGAMLCVDTALRGLARPPAMLHLFSACLICESKWKPLAGNLRSTRVLQSHGRLDQVLPFQTGIWLAEMLQEAGCSVEMIEFNGVHTIPYEVIERAAGMLSELTDS